MEISEIFEVAMLEKEYNSEGELPGLERLIKVEILGFI
jgi:hypothetical protein